MDSSIDLTPDCSACAALCCVVFAFDKSESFAIDKAAGEVCPNLNDHMECRVFKDRERLGFRGCITYNCYGAGQRVTQDIFKGKTWRQNPAIKNRMGEALSVLRRIHEQLSLLSMASKMPLKANERSTLQTLEKNLMPVPNWTEDELANYPIDRMTKDVSAFLLGLRRLVVR
ncbi:hypothetical protein [Roseibium sp. SCP14]|uniref:hypothetical protein n=1 Tax=Roseibium sp. SCP14 TaxID=3141375 RepID=UPI00333DFCAD